MESKTLLEPRKYMNFEGTSRPRKRPHTGADEHEYEPADKVVIGEDTQYRLLSLSDEILLEIAKNLDGNSLSSLGNTCMRLYNLVSDRHLWTKVDLTSEELSHWEILHRFRYVNEDTEEIAIRGLAATYPHLTWKKETVTKEVLKKLWKTCPKIDSLSISHGFMNLEEVKVVDFPSTLRRLSFHECAISAPKEADSFFKGIYQHMTNLEELYLEYCNWFATHDLLAFSKLPNLKKLSLRGCMTLNKFVPYGSIATRFGFRKLEYLDVSETPIIDADIQCFNITATLKSLIMGCPEELYDPPIINSSPGDDEKEWEGDVRLTNLLLKTASSVADPGTEPATSSNSTTPTTSGSVKSRRIIPNIIIRKDGEESDEDQDNCIHIVLNDRSIINVPRDTVINNRNQSLVQDTNRALRGQLWFERNYRPAFPQSCCYELITDLGICSFGVLRQPVIEGLVWIRTTHNRCADSYLEKLVVRNYRKVSDVALVHLAQCAPNLVYLDVSRTSVTEKGIEVFKLSKPNCRVIAEHLVDYQDSI